VDMAAHEPLRSCRECWLLDLFEINAYRLGRVFTLPEQLHRVTMPLQWRQWDRAMASPPDPRFREYLASEWYKKGISDRVL